MGGSGACAHALFIIHACACAQRQASSELGVCCGRAPWAGVCVFGLTCECARQVRDSAVLLDEMVSEQGGAGGDWAPIPPSHARLQDRLRSVYVSRLLSVGL